MSRKGLGRRLARENRAWLEAERRRRAEAKRAAAAERQRIDGLYPISLSSIADALNTIDARGMVIEVTKGRIAS